VLLAGESLGSIAAIMTTRTATESSMFLASISSAGDGQSRENGFTFKVLMANDLHHAAEIRASLKK
jgi:hypothetical protein